VDYTIVSIQTCYFDDTKVRVIAELNKDISEIIPYLNRVMQGGIYNNNNQTLTIRNSGKLITFSPTKMSATRLEDISEAKCLFNNLLQRIEQTYQNQASIEPDTSRGVILHPLEVYKLLPKRNCGKCGVPSCMAYATMLTMDLTNIQFCLPLFTEEYFEQKRALLVCLEEAGLCVPEIFV
jgi:ArsR family metal-binding transcriptional regulator